MKLPPQTGRQGKAQASGAVEPLVPARRHFSDTISLNPDMAESEREEIYCQDRRAAAIGQLKSDLCKDHWLY